eukprot:gene937-biopygen791
MWQVVSIDFVTGLPRTERGYAAFATFTYKLSKMVHVVPMLYSDSSVEQAARMYFDHVWQLHGAPIKIVWDRDSRFRDAFHTDLHRLMGVQVASATPYHPQGDGQAEHTNHTVERMPRAYVDANQMHLLASHPSSFPMGMPQYSITARLLRRSCIDLS